MGPAKDAGVGEMVRPEATGTTAAQALPDGVEPADFLLGRRRARRPVSGVDGREMIGVVLIAPATPAPAPACVVHQRHPSASLAPPDPYSPESAIYPQVRTTPRPQLNSCPVAFASVVRWSAASQTQWFGSGPKLSRVGSLAAVAIQRCR